MGKLVALLALLVAIAVLAAIGWTWWQGRGAVHQLAGAETRAGEATVDAGQAHADADIDRILGIGQARERHAQSLAESHHDQILSAPGADAPLDPRLVDTTRRGLCQYAAYRDDSECARLRAQDPAELPQAGPAGATPPS